MQLWVTVWLCREHVQILTEHAERTASDIDLTVGSGVCYSAEHGNEEVPAVCSARLLLEPAGWSRATAQPVEDKVTTTTPKATKAKRPRRAAILSSDDSAQKYVVCPYCSQIHWIGSDNADPDELVCACQKKILVKAN